MKRIITWVKPTGNGMHIGNYFWAIVPFLKVAEWKEAYLFIADYHSLTSVHDKKTMEQNKFNLMCEYFALVPESSNVVIFEQSSVKRINDFAWILSSVTPYSLMLRAHSFKDAQAKNSDINMAVFNYPILMAADILAYDIDIVPVGKDQTQHLEFARDIAGNFNNTFGEILKLPEAYIEKEGETILGIDGRKMSKSYNNFIPLFGSEKEIKKVIMSIVTDDTPLEAPKNPDTCNVFAFIKMFANKEKQEEIRQKYLAGNYWYGHAKLELLEIYLNYFKEARQKYELFQKYPEELYKKLEIWNKKANELADEKFAQLKSAVWL